jgi:hypothetical protein
MHGTKTKNAKRKILKHLTWRKNQLIFWMTNYELVNSLKMFN